MGLLATELAERTTGKACLVTAFDVCNPLDTHTDWLTVIPGMGIGDMLENRCFSTTASIWRSSTTARSST